MPGTITRRRTGCVVCRSRRIKCDEAKPSCQNCIRSSKSCNWLKDRRFIQETRGGLGQKKSSRLAAAKNQGHEPHGNQAFAVNGEIPTFTPSTSDEFLSPTLSGSLSHQPSSIDRSMSSGSSNMLLDCGPDLSDQQLQAEALDLNGKSPDASSDHAALILSSVTEICRSESAKLRNSIEIEHASPIPPNLDPNPEGFTDWNALGISDELQSVMNTDVEVVLLQNYIWECAPWFDANNSKQNYSKTDVPRMMNCPPWRAAALALSAKNMDLLKGNCTNSDSLSLHLYQLAVRLAIDSISGRFDCVGTLAGCVLLAVYEMMTVSYTDWRRHLQGCASIYIHNGWNGSTGGLISASFWDYARIDIWAAICSATNTLICPSIWFNEPQDIMSLTDVDEDKHAQISTWLLGRTVNLIHRNQATASGSLFEELDRLREDLSKWESMGSAACCAIMSRDASPDEDIPFPRILFSSHSSIIGHTMFHTAMVLLLEFDQGKSPSTTADAIYYHSRIACGIIRTNDHTACLVNSLQPMWVCGRHLRTKAEKSAALEILAQIEKRTGWKCDWRSRGLREIWGVG